jgi:hypothetical protein
VIAAADTHDVPEGFVRLVSSVRLRTDPDRIAALLATGGPWASDRVEHAESADLRRFAVDLRLRVGAEPAAFTTFSKAAYLDLGQPRRTATGWELEIGWSASTAAPLFPVFSGWLTIEADELRLEGLYAPPGGVIGRVADRMLLHIAANATARWLLDEIARAAR